MFIDYVKFIDKVEAPDETHVVFTCSKPKANMLGLWIPILPEHVWSKVKPAEVENKFKNPPPIVGSGPFQTVEWKKGEYVRMVANKDYWRGAPKVDEVIFQTYQNQDTMAQDLKTGAIQSGWNIPSAQFDALNSEPDLESIRAVTIGFDELGFNCADKKKYPKSTGHPVLQDPAFRSALQWAIDKEKIVSIGYNGNAAPADTIVTQGLLLRRGRLPLDAAGDPYTLRSREGRQALDAAGYPTATATASASTRASPSSCASTRAPSRRRARTAASSSPAGSRRSASTSTTRSSTTAPSATSSTTTTATSSRPTSTCSSGAGAATSTPTSSCPS